jgi:hypothetical protein
MVLLTPTEELNSCIFALYLQIFALYLRDEMAGWQNGRMVEWRNGILLQYIPNLSCYLWYTPTTPTTMPMTPTAFKSFRCTEIYFYCKKRLLADQVNLYFIQLFVFIWQFSGSY